MAVTQFFDPFGVQLQDRNTESEIGYRRALTGMNLLSMQQQMDQRANLMGYMDDIRRFEQEQRQKVTQAPQGGPGGPQGAAAGMTPGMDPNAAPTATGRIQAELNQLDKRIEFAQNRNVLGEVDRLIKMREQTQGRLTTSLDRDALGRKRMEDENEKRSKFLSEFAYNANSIWNDDKLSPEDKIMRLEEGAAGLRSQNPEAYKRFALGGDQINWTDPRTWGRIDFEAKGAVPAAKQMELRILQQKADEQMKHDRALEHSRDARDARLRESMDAPKAPVGMRWTDKTHTELEPIPVRGVSTAETKGLSGDEFLAALPPGDAGLIKGIADGKVDPKTLSIKGGHREQILKQVLQYRPEYNQSKFPIYQAVQKDFTSGVAARNVTAINTAIAHMGTLDDLGQALQNKDTQVVNKVTNAVASQFGDPRINNFQTAASALSSEMMRVFRQVGASEKEQKDWESKFGDIQSPDQMKGALKTGAKLLEGRIDALNDQWKRGMDSKQGYPDLLAPKSVQVINKLGLKVPGVEAAPAKKSSGPVPLDEYLKSREAKP